ncbi:MAG: type II secretion system protein [Candidatus Marinimicrobia bacterium]|jgi:prepilin-type N-terminal cleavage/methylation domain-containing protein|nr:type II secretion system protein [Candidatus Neomarinimicrobiota bacterium]MBT3631834.1 type II secretion system protein [Candidatus Neomarinimicrobiota bacterium]MBT3825244.1 type II secretion system protein [Candidatus Neomarinimicrobiota bacterium]MBT4129386.1 type II secretion system protein [Candidatus Neomarinimicrobiota bacterium]MBT4296891.1 type II secretion system protein [Candidatus Neomarinimicrobiota bacterium]
MLKKILTNTLFKKLRTRFPQRSFTLIEIIFSVTLLSIVAMGTAQYMVFSRWDIDRGIRRQLAWINMASRMEQAIDWGYVALPDSLPETNQLITANNLTAYRTTEVFGIDDTTDGVAPTDTELPDYYMIKIYISWFTTGNVSDSLTAYISEEMGWDY